MMFRLIASMSGFLAFVALLQLPLASAFLLGPVLPRIPTLSRGQVSKVQAGASAYAAETVQAAWDNHLAGFGSQDVEKVLLDYDEDSVITTYDLGKDEKNVFKGVEEVRACFTSIFASMADTSDLSLPSCDVSEEGKMVFIIWRCPASGYVDATDTFVFGEDNKIRLQNVVFKKV